MSCQILDVKTFARVSVSLSQGHISVLHISCFLATTAMWDNRGPEEKDNCQEGVALNAKAFKK